MVRFLHTRIRVSSLDNSMNWYKELGFKLVRKLEKSPQGNEIWFLEIEGGTLELTYSPDYEVKVPEDLMHIAIGVDDILTYCEELESKQYDIWPSNWKESFEKKKMAFLTDPDGYEVEILER